MEEEKNRCSCGLATGNLFSKFDRLKQELRKDKPDLWTAQDLIDDVRIGTISNVEKECKIDLKEETELLDEAKKDIFDLEFENARGNVQKADFNSWNKLLKCAERD